MKENMMKDLIETKRNNISSISNHNSDIDHPSDSKYKCNIWE